MDTLDLFNDDKTCKINFEYIHEMRCYFSIYEFINLAYGKDIYDIYGRDTFKKMFILTDRNDDISYQYSVDGKNSTAMADINSLEKILSILPDNEGKKYQFLSIHTKLNICRIYNQN